MATLAIHSPYDNKLVQEIPMHSAAEVAEVFSRASASFSDKSQHLSKHERINVLEKLFTIVSDQQEALILTATREGGKPYQDTKIEVERALQGIRYTITCLQQQHGREIPMGLTASTSQRLAITQHEPVGIVYAISAFNHPLNLIIHQVLPAFAVGCPVIIKPASTTPLSCIKLVEFLHAAGCPQAWCQVIHCDNDVAEKFVSDKRVAFLSFIGSAKVGWYLRSLLPPGANCALEHGGAAPVIIEPDAKLEKALPLIVKGGFYHAGQVCVSVQRLFVWHKNAKSFAKKIAEQAKKLIVGDPLDHKTEVGPLILTREVERLEAWVQEAVHAGAKVLCGGKKITDSCYAPTVLYDPPDHVQVSQQEIFGPIICVYPYKDRSEAISRANQLDFCFQAAVFSQDIDNALDMVKQLTANTVLINDHTAFRADWMPFGGRQASGLGLGGIPYSMHDLSHEKLMVIHSESV